MDNSVLKKRLNTFKSDKGTLSNVSNEVVMEVLRAWEQWPGPTSTLYRELGLSKMQLVIMIKKGKKLVKAGAIPESEFKEVALGAVPSLNSASGGCTGIEVNWTSGQLIRFPDVDQLLEFLKKAA